MYQSLYLHAEDLVFQIRTAAASNFSATIDFRGGNFTYQCFDKSTAWHLGYYYTHFHNSAHPNDYDTFTTTGSNITSAIKVNAADPAIANSHSTYDIASGDYISCPCVLRLNSGVAPEIVIVDSTGNDISNVVTLVNGPNYPLLIATGTDAASMIRIRNTDGEVSNF
jgi:hypothetical protein